MVLQKDDLSIPPAVPKDALGFAPGAGPDSEHAYILYNNIEALAMRFGESDYAKPVNLLGCSIAHEIGHMLLPGPSRSQAGIMRKAWDLRDLRYATRIERNLY